MKQDHVNRIIYWRVEGPNHRKADCWHKHRADCVHKRDKHIWRDTKLHVRQKSFTASVGQVGPQTRSGCVGYKGGTHGRYHVENVRSVCWGHGCALLDASNTPHGNESIQHRSKNQLTTGSRSTSYTSILSFTQQPHTSDLEICLWSQLYDTIHHSQENQLRAVFSLQTTMHCSPPHTLCFSAVLSSAVCNRVESDFRCDRWCQTHRFQHLRNSCLSRVRISGISWDQRDEQLRSWGHNMPR